MKASANSGLGAQLTEPEGFRSAQHNVSVRLSPTVQKTPQSSPDLGRQNVFAVFVDTCRRLCTFPVMGLRDGDGHRVIHQPSHSDADTHRDTKTQLL